MWTYQYPDYLMHGGPGSGRYPAGSGKRPWQHRGIRWIISRRKEKKQQKQYAKNRETLRKKREESETAKSLHEKMKAKAIAEANATEVLRYRSEYSNKELQYALDRIKLKADIENYSKKELSKSWKRMDDAVATVGRVNTYAKAAIDFGNNVKTIYDMMNGKFQSKGGEKQQEGKKKSS